MELFPLFLVCTLVPYLIKKSLGVMVFWICLREEIQSWQTKVLTYKIRY